jgi:hypothetical protein
VLAAGAIGTGIAALSKSHELESQVNDHPTAVETIHSTHQSAVTLALASDLLAGAAVAAAGVTLYVTYAAKKPAPAPSPRAEVRVGPLGVLVRGTF